MLSTQSSYTIGLNFQSQSSGHKQNTGVVSAEQKHFTVLHYIESHFNIDPMVPLHDSVVSAVLVVIGAFSLFSNGMVLFTIYRYPCLKHSFNVFVANLALVDIFNSAFGTPLAVKVLLSQPRLTSKALCFANSSSFCLITTMMFSSLALMTVNRYYRVARPAKFRQIFTVKRSLVIAISSWFVNIILSSTALVSVTPISAYRLDKIDCFHLQKPLVGLLIYLLIFVVPPSSVVVVFYFKTHRFIYKPKAAIFSALRSMPVQRYSEEAKTLRVLLVLLLSSYCYLAPVSAVWTVEEMIPDPPHFLSIMGLLFEHLMSVIIPGVYIFASRFYRKEIYRLVTCKYHS